MWEPMPVIVRHTALASVVAKLLRWVSAKEMNKQGGYWDSPVRPELVASLDRPADNAAATNSFGVNADRPLERAFPFPLYMRHEQERGKALEIKTL
jgi:hypothetical protein